MQTSILLCLVAIGSVAAQDVDGYEPEVTKRVYFDITIDEEYVGRIKFGLFGNDVPITARNFYELAIAKDGQGYKSTRFHRVVKNFLIQGGIYFHEDGTDGQSFYGTTFDDENFRIHHNKEGLLSMANRGPNTNDSQFFIILAEAPQFDGKHVVFGKVLDEESMNVVRRIANVDTSPPEKPTVLILIKDSGALPDEQ